MLVDDALYNEIKEAFEKKRQEKLEAMANAPANAYYNAGVIKGLEEACELFKSTYKAMVNEEFLD